MRLEVGLVVSCLWAEAVWVCGGVSKACFVCWLLRLVGGCSSVLPCLGVLARVLRVVMEALLPGLSAQRRSVLVEVEARVCWVLKTSSSSSRGLNRRC